MDVSKSNPLTSDLNKRKLAPDASWSATLNRAAHGKAKDSSLMGVKHAPTLANAKLSESPLAGANEKFARVLDAASDQRKPLDEKQQAKLDGLEKSSTTLVNQFFMGSMLKQMRESPFKTEMFNGGKGGDAYAGLFDQHIAEHAGNRIAKSLVKSMVKQYAKAIAATGATTGIAS